MSKEMKIVKERLYLKYGQKCEVCGKEFGKAELTGHHIIEKCRGGKISEDNILIACYHCHFVVINNMVWGSKEYWDLMYRSLVHRNEGASS